MIGQKGTIVSNINDFVMQKCFIALKYISLAAKFKSVQV